MPRKRAQMGKMVSNKKGAIIIDIGTRKSWPE
jgi:hypothetical protein